METVCIALQDIGIGIAPEKLNTIFHKFIQADSSISRKYGGTGLGLAITRTLIDIMGGVIEVESKLGMGSTFKVCLPLEMADKDHAKHADNVQQQIPEDFSLNIVRPMVLLVEDYPANVMVATAYLEQFGYACDLASSGMEAIEKIKLTSYSIVLMDVRMPGINGLEATNLIRSWEKQHSKTKTIVIGMTAHALLGDRERCIASGMNDYIAKPFDPIELQTKLKVYIEKSFI